MKYKIAFLTEMGFNGRVPNDHPNMRTELAWMNALGAEHFNLLSYPDISGFDFIFVIWPKGRLDLNAEGLTLSNKQPKRMFNVLCESGEIEKIIPDLKMRNGKVFFVQEGPASYWEDYTLFEQIYYHTILSQSDVIFCHNESDKKHYDHYDKPVHVIRTLLIEDLIKDIKPVPKKKIILGGNFCRWYGGMKSYLVAFPLLKEGYQIHAPSMHNKREAEEQLVQHLPYKTWVDWMKELSTFKIGIHMMPTIAAGTFSLNCAYLGIPVIGNQEVDTQRLCHTGTSLDVDNVSNGLVNIERLYYDEEFYKDCSQHAISIARKLFIKEPWLDYMINILNSL